MSSDRDKKGSSYFTRARVLIPFVVAVASLIFGAYEYLGKMELEKLQAHDIVQRNKASISVDYLEADLAGIYGDLGGDFNTACSMWWLPYLESVLSFDVELELLDCVIHEEIEESKGYSDSIEAHYVSFFLIRNGGGGAATNISTTFKRKLNGEREDYPIEVPQLDPGTGFIFAIDHFNRLTKETYGTRLVPGEELEYFDVFLDKREVMPIRERATSIRLIAPKIRRRA